MEPKQLVLEAEHITVIGHVAPDGDVVGSMLGFAAALSASTLHKECLLVSPDEIPEMFGFLPGVERILTTPGQLGPTDLLLVLDTSDAQRLGRVYDDNLDLFQTVPVLNIDHHSENSFVATAAIVDPTAAATAELVTTFLHELAIPVNSLSAHCLLTGLVSDTQCFRTPSTNARSLEIATHLMERGANLAGIVDCLYKRYPFSKLSLWGQALATITLSGNVVWIAVTQDAIARSGSSTDETDGLIDILSSIKDARVAALFKEMPEGGTKVSLRSSGEINVARLAAQFGGGGHAAAAGLTFAGAIEEAQEHVIGYVNRQLSGY